MDDCNGGPSSAEQEAGLEPGPVSNAKVSDVPQDTASGHSGPLLSSAKPASLAVRLLGSLDFKTDICTR
jgi:hypothetical protein